MFSQTRLPITFLAATSSAQSILPNFTNFWDVSPPLDYNDTLYAGWSQLPALAEVEVYNGVDTNRTYAHHPEIYARNNSVYLIHSSGLVDEDSMGQNVWLTTSTDGGFTWTPSMEILPSALLPNQTSELNFSYWCNEGVQQRALGALTIIDYNETLYALGETTNFWCAGSLGSGNHGAGRVARPIGYDGSIAGDPCWIEKTNWTDFVGYPETVYGTEYGMKYCDDAAALRAILAEPDHVPAWSAWLYNGNLYTENGVNYMQENTFAVWIEELGVWQRFWRDITATNNTMKVWVEYSATGLDWYPVAEHRYGNRILETNIPDAKTKQFFLDVEDQEERVNVLISNPRNNSELVRQPLTIATARGSGLQQYKDVGVLRTNASSVIAPDTRDYKNQGFSYPTAIRVGDNLVVGYSENKENIWVSVLKIADLP
ncbi:putative Sialidase domain-containing protein [Seiridium unicorne]|uniref:Sialidase domain-containing protein n=1 Tax=Seiridium unicorne TaxID=138068 RepID=A0ABR2UE19_9PEZI